MNLNLTYPLLQADLDIACLIKTLEGVDDNESRSFHAILSLLLSRTQKTRFEFVQSSITLRLSKTGIPMESSCRRMPRKLICIAVQTFLESPPIVLDYLLGIPGHMTKYSLARHAGGSPVSLRWRERAEDQRADKFRDTCSDRVRLLSLKCLNCNDGSFSLHSCWISHSL